MHAPVSRSLLTVCAVLLLAGCSAGVSSSGQPSSLSPQVSLSDSNAAVPTRSIHDPPGGTKVVVLKPVTTTGLPAAGWQTINSAKQATYCGGPGFGALSAEIHFCGWTAAYTPACWPSAEPAQVLCLHNPWDHSVEVWRMNGKLRPVAPARHPVPIALTLTNGLQCFVRIGGTWGHPVGHPELHGTYFCQSPNTKKWGPQLWATRHSSGIDRTEATWTVQLASDRSGPVTRGEVATAYYVATAPAGS
jgi:hypothetical protein